MRKDLGRPMRSATWPGQVDATAGTALADIMLSRHEIRLVGSRRSVGSFRVRGPAGERVLSGCAVLVLRSAGISGLSRSISRARVLRRRAPWFSWTRFSWTRFSWTRRPWLGPRTPLGSRRSEPRLAPPGLPPAPTDTSASPGQASAPALPGSWRRVAWLRRGRGFPDRSFR
jgi:hypothetical protein